MNTDELIAELVKRRVAKELTQKQVAERMGCHTTFVQRIEANKGDRQVSQLFRYAAALEERIGFFVQ